MEYEEINETNRTEEEKDLLRLAWLWSHRKLGDVAYCFDGLIFR